MSETARRPKRDFRHLLSFYVSFYVSFLSKTLLRGNSILRKAARASLERKHCAQQRLVHLANETRDHCNLQDSTYCPQGVLLVMPSQPIFIEQVNNEILQRGRLLCDTLLHLSLSSLVERQFCKLTNSQAAYIAHEIIVRVTKSDYCLLALGHVWEVYASLQYAFFT